MHPKNPEIINFITYVLIKNVWCVPQNSFRGGSFFVPLLCDWESKI